MNETWWKKRRSITYVDMHGFPYCYIIQYSYIDIYFNLNTIYMNLHVYKIIYYVKLSESSGSSEYLTVNCPSQQKQKEASSRDTFS